MRKTINIEKMVEEVRTYLLAAAQHMKVDGFVHQAERALKNAEHILSTLYIMLPPDAILDYNLREYDSKWLALTANLRSMK